MANEKDFTAIEGDRAGLESTGRRRGDLLVAGETVRDYTVAGVLAEGGGGVVYEAVHGPTGRLAALKVLHGRLAVSPKIVKRFEREVEMLNLLRHPGIVGVWDVGTLGDGRPFFVMERVAGHTVATLLQRAGRLLPAEAVEILVAVCEVLAVAHAAGIVHRDIKPSNIMVVSNWPATVKLLDFGVAKLHEPEHGSSGLTSEGQILGTPGSMAPEQILGRPVDGRTDIYALGVLLYRMLTGGVPFPGPDAFKQISQHLQQPAPRPSLRVPAAVALDPIVLRCMAKEPSQRFQSVGELAEALRSTFGEPLLHAERAPVDVAELGAAIYVEIRAAEECTGEDLATAMGFMLDAAEDRLRDESFQIAFITGNEVLAVKSLSADADAALGELLEVVSIAVVLREHLHVTHGAEGRAHANVCVHVDAVSLAKELIDIDNGPLVRPDLWAPRQIVPAVCGTEATLRRLGGEQGGKASGIVPVPPGPGASDGAPRP